MNLTKMKLQFKMEVALIFITTVLCVILLLKILNRLRSSLPWRVNCWFCNSNVWIKYPDHNSWTCPKCEQYNGFTKDGDYNKTITTATEQVIMTPKVFQKSPPKNGLCKMCNINQQLKVTQLANFVPMNENNFEEEIEGYRMQLEKAYKLCSSCRKVLQTKLHKEKETLLGAKLLETRTPDKKHQMQEKQSRALRDIINNTSMLIVVVLFILASYEMYSILTTHENLPKIITNIIDIAEGLLERVCSILKMKIYTTFPSMEIFIDKNYGKVIDMLPKSLNIRIKTLNHLNMTVQEALGVIACLIQIVANLKNVNTLRYTIALDLLWTVFVLSIAEMIVALNPLLISVIKTMSVLTLLLLYNNMKKPGRNITKNQTSPKSTKKFNLSKSALIDHEDAIAMDSDDDVSLCKFGLHNLSESSNETISPLNASLMNGRSFTPRNDSSLWTKPMKSKLNSTLNSTFTVNPVVCKSPSSVSDTVFVKPSFNNYQKLTKDDSDSELDESISCLTIGSPTKSKKKTNSIFSIRKFTASPNFITPTVMNRVRPLISPSKLGHSTSWVAGGYWGSDSERQNIFNADGSRSSSQSSGFESQTSSMNQRNVFSQPPSREESVCGEPMVLDRFPNMSYLSNYQTPQNYSRVSSPVFPPLQYNGHVHIPQARFAQNPNPQNNIFIQQSQYVQNGMFKTPGASGLIKLPRTNTFSSQ